MKNDYLMIKELYHYGIKGQKWGVIRTPEELGYEDRKVYDSLSDKDKKVYMKFSADERKKFNSLPSKSEKKAPSGISKYENDDGTLTREGRKVLKNLGKKQGFVSNIDRDLEKARKAGYENVYMSGADIRKYQKYKKDADRIIKKLDMDNVRITAGTEKNKLGEEFATYLFENPEKSKSMNQKAVYFYKYK